MTNLPPGPLRVSSVCVTAGGTRILNMVDLRDPDEGSGAMGSLPVAEVGPRGYVARLIETGQQRPPFSFGCGGLER